MINPLWHGSGVNIKMVELLATGRPVVSTSAGTRGLAGSVSQYAKIGDTRETFAQAVLGGLDESFSAEQRETVLDEYSWTNVDMLIDALRQVSGIR